MECPPFVDLSAAHMHPLDVQSTGPGAGLIRSGGSLMVVAYRKETIHGLKEPLDGGSLQSYDASDVVTCLKSEIA